jgi:plasmid stabilization system protein ParE
MKVEVLDIAQQELNDAFEWYESLNSGLGYEFISEVDTSIITILAFPKSWRKVGNSTRRCVINRFPFILLYYIDNDTIYITCVAHQHRNPEYHSDRIN